MLSRLYHTTLKAKSSFIKGSVKKQSLFSLQLSNRNFSALTLPKNRPGSGSENKRFALPLLGSVLAFSTAVAAVTESEPEILDVEENLTPLYEPVFRESGMLKVSDVHTISYKVYGNPKGKPVLCVHGGPGAGTGTGKVYVFAYFVKPHP